jgi:hypothetical protein
MHNSGSGSVMINLGSTDCGEAAQVCGNAVCGNIELKRTNDHHEVHRRENSDRSLKVLE